MRVTVECCLQERSWNPYYMHLLQRLLAASKAHRVTLQYCLWDQFKQAEQADMRRLINLAHLTGQLIATFTLSSSILKVTCLCRNAVQQYSPFLCASSRHCAPRTCTILPWAGDMFWCTTNGLCKSVLPQWKCCASGPSADVFLA